IAVVRSAGQARRSWAVVLGLAALTSLWGLADALRQTTRQGPFVIFCVAAGGLLTAALVAGAFARREPPR
ncbi:MAG: hypothetical protein KC486_32685, partial [Myxococcales bacterium]|nr:hypothetical protein [Myxococcales bacterium]